MGDLISLLDISLSYQSAQINMYYFENLIKCVIKYVVVKSPKRSELTLWPFSFLLGH